MRMQVTCPEKCPSCNKGVLEYEYFEGITDQSNVIYECTECHIKYTWEQLGGIMYFAGITDSMKAFISVGEGEKNEDGRNKTIQEKT